MAKFTLLEIVQDILNDLNSDPVNSINDTPEALQVAQIVKTTYNDMISTRNWAQEQRTLQLSSVSDPATPTHLQLPDDLKEMKSFFYDQRKDSAETKTKLEEIFYKEPEVFLRETNGRNEDESNVQTVTDFGGVTIKVRNDTPPTFWTSFDEEYIVLDAFSSDFETTVQSSNTQVIGYVEKPFTFADNFVPSLPSEAHASLLAESKGAAFNVLRQEINQRVEANAFKQRSWLSRKNWAAKGGVRYPNYGRVRHTTAGRKNPMLSKDG